MKKLFIIGITTGFICCSYSPPVQKLHPRNHYIKIEIIECKPQKRIDSWVEEPAEDREGYLL